MVAEEVLITLSGGAPWGFRLQGGVDNQKPLQVAKVRKRSKACRAGLKETDELVSINDQPCDELSHAQAMILIDASQGILHIRVKRVPAGFQSVVLVTRAPSPRIDKEYRASLQTLSPTDLHQAPVREVHRSRSSLTSGLTSPPGSEAYYGETDSDADVAGYERQRRQKRRSPNSNTGKPTGRTSPEGGETSEMSGYDSAPDAQAYPNLSEGHGGGETGGLPGVARREVIYQPPAPGLWSSQTSTETSSIISSADDQGPRDGEQEDFLELANVPLVSPERAKEALMLRSRNQLVPMVGPVNNPVDEELTTTYMEKAKQAKLNRGDTPQDKNVKEARSKCRTIASLLTDAPNPHSKGVLMFKKRRQRSKKYTLTSFGSVDEDQCLDSQEEDGVLPGSESEFEEEGFSAAPDPTWDSDYLDMLEKRATAGVEGRGDGEEDAPSPGLDATTGKGAQLFEQQRKRAAEHAKKAEAIQSQAAQQAINEQAQMFYPDSQGYTPMQQDVYQVQPSFNMSNGDLSQATGGTAKMGMQGGPRPAIDSVDMITGNTPQAETFIPEAPASNVLNRTARPFTPGFITIRAATAPVAFNPSATKTNQRPTSAAAVPPPFSTIPEQSINATSVMLQLSPGPASSSKASAPVTHTAGASVILNPSTSSFFVEPSHTAQQTTAAYPVQYVNVPPVPPAPPQPMFSAPSEIIVSASPYVVSGPPQHILSATPPFKASAPIPPISQIPGSIQQVALCPPVVPVAPPPCPIQIPMTPLATVSMVSEPEAIAPTPVSGQGGRTGILLESRRRGGKPKPMFNVPEVKRNSPNPELLSMVHNFDERATNPKHSHPFYEDFYDAAQEASSTAIGIGKMPPPVAPKPRVLQEAPQIIQAGGKGAQLFVRRQNRMGMYVVDAPPPTHYQDEVPLHGTAQPLHTSSIPSGSSQWKYSSNVRAPPPIGYNPLLAPSIPTGPQRNMNKPGNKSRGGSQREGIQALDFMRRQPYQLNSAMFNYSGSAANLSASPSHHDKRQGHHTAMVGSSLTSPKQIPVKTARAYEIKRFSTPTPMSAPTLVPKVLAPRSATTLGERIDDSDMTTPPPSLTDPTSDVKLARAPFGESVSLSSQIGGLPSLPKLSAMPPPNLVPGVAAHCIPVSYNTGLQAAKQFQSAPELSILSSLPPLKSNPIQAPKPRFVANKGGVQAHVWRPGAI